VARLGNRFGPHDRALAAARRAGENLNVDHYAFPRLQPAPSANSVVCADGHQDAARQAQKPVAACSIEKMATGFLVSNDGPDLDEISLSADEMSR